MKEKNMSKVVHKKVAFKKKSPAINELKMLREFAIIEAKINIKNFKVKASVGVCGDGFEGLYKNANYAYFYDEEYVGNASTLN